MCLQGRECGNPPSLYEINRAIKVRVQSRTFPELHLAGNIPVRCICEVCTRVSGGLGVDSIPN